MKICKKYFLIIFMIFLVFMTISASRIEKINYHTGEDFVQLFFKTDSIVSIPDIFYPEKNNQKYLVMRVSDIVFNKSKKNYNFDSPIIDSLKIVKKKGYCDFEIKLLEEVNYRVASNERGFLIEFPKVKRLVVKTENKKIKKTRKMRKSINVTKNQYSKNNRLNGFEILEHSKNNIKFKFNMTAGKVKHQVIEVNEKPYRLALDLLNTKSKRINKKINYFNVTKLRGAPNRAGVFRLVFDLNSLKNFEITEERGALLIEFFNKKHKKVIVKNNIKTKKPVKKVTTKTLEILKTDKLKSNKLIVKNKVPKKIKKNKELKIDSNDEYFSEPTSEAFDGEAGNFIQVEDDKGNVRKGVVVVHGGEPKYKGSPININVKNADLANVINGFSELAKINIILDPGVTGKITANLKQVPWDQALDLFLKINRLGKVIEGNILRIGKLSVLAREAKELKSLEIAKAAVEDMIVKNYPVSYAKATALSKIIKEQLSPRGKFYVDTRTNTLIVTDIPEKLKIVDNLVELLDTPTTQVSIEAKIIETSVNYYNALGIQWGYNVIADAAHGNPTSLQFPNSIGVGGNLISSKTAPGVLNPSGVGGYAINLPAPTFNVGTAFTLGNVADTFRLDLALTAMESSGKGRILSSPKTTTQNNLSAKISQGNKIPLQTIQNNTVTVKYVDAVLELEVTPQITAKGTIKMELTIKNDNPDWTNQVNGIPPLTTQSLTTTIMAKDGETIVIGGMYKIEDSTARNKVPLLSRIPIIGNLFKNKLKTGSRKEILIFVTPRIVK